LKKKTVYNYQFATMNTEEGKLKDLLKRWEGSQVIDQDASNIFVYKPRRSSTQKPHQDSFEDEQRANCSGQSTYDAVPPNTTPKKKKKKKKKQPLQGTQPKSQRASERNDEDQVSFKKYPSGKDVRRKKVSFAPKSGLNNRVHPQPDIEQPSTQRQLITPRRKRTTHSAPSCCDDLMGYRFRSFKESLLRFKGIKFVQISLAIYITVLTFADIGWPGGLRDTETGLIIDKDSPERTEAGLILINGTERAIAASTLFQVGCIGVARVSAWLMYPGKCWHIPPLKVLKKRAVSNINL
jgi:hypothetical protein